MFRLALSLGFYNPDEMIQNTPPKLIHEWLEYSQIEPFGEERSDLRNAMLMALVSSGLGGKSKTISDFMPNFKAENKKKPVRNPEKLLRKYFK